MKNNNNKKSIIIIVAILVVVLALFALIRGCDKKEEPKKDEKKPVEVVPKEEIEEVEDYYVEATTPTVTPVVAKEEEKQILTLMLNGDDIIYIDKDDVYNDEGAFASDTVDGNLTEAITTVIYKITIDEASGSETREIVDAIDTSVPGVKFEIEYSITNSAGETKTIVRTVVVNDVKSTTFTLKGNKTVTVELGDEFTDDGVEAIETINGKENSLTVTTKYYKKDLVTGAISSIGELDTNVLGNFVIMYVTYDSNGVEYMLQRDVEIKDTTSPVVTAKDGKSEFKIAIDSESEDNVNIEDYYTVVDADTNLDIKYEIKKDPEQVVTEIPMKEEGTYNVTVTVTDSSDNASTPLSFKLILGEDTTAPNVVLTPSTNVVDEVTNVEVGLAITDDYSEVANIKVYYAFVDTISEVDDQTKDATQYLALNESTSWIDLTEEKISFSYTTLTATDKTLLIKAVDEKGNFTIYNYKTKQDQE